MPMTPAPSAQTVTADSLPWKSFAQNGIVEIQTVKTERAVIAWSGFDASAFDDATNRKHAKLIANAVNNYATLTTSLAAASARIGELEAGEKALRGELWQLRQIVTDIRVLNNAGQFKQFEGEPWLRRACNIDLHHDPAATDVAFRSALSQTEEGR